jgi:hypothetical protein
MTQKQLANAAWRMVGNADAKELGKLTVSEIARRLMVNRSTFSRAFSDYYPYLTLREFMEMKKISKDLDISDGGLYNVFAHLQRPRVNKQLNLITRKFSMTLNKISAEVPQEQETQAIQYVKDIKSLLPFLIGLNSEERVSFSLFRQSRSQCRPFLTRIPR